MNEWGMWLHHLCDQFSFQNEQGSESGLGTRTGCIGLISSSGTELDMKSSNAEFLALFVEHLGQQAWFMFVILVNHGVIRCLVLSCFLSSRLVCIDFSRLVSSHLTSSFIPLTQ